jgi:hypothetical protein
MKRQFWVVMTAVPFEDIRSSNGEIISLGEDGPEYFMPVFESLEKAEAWAEGRPIVECEASVDTTLN